VLFRLNGKQVKRRVGAVHERGRPRDGALNRDAARERANEIVTELVAAAEAPAAAGRTFRELAFEYLRWVERLKRPKPSTLHDYRWSLSESGRVISALGDTPAREITAADIETLLDSIEAAGLSARTINKTRNLIGAVFAYGVRKHGLHANPARATDKRREGQRPPLEVFTVQEIEKLAETMEDRQDAAMVRIAAYTGLRMGELRALRWGDVGRDVVTVSRALSNDELSTTKGGRVRHVPLVPQAREALDRLRERRDFTGRDELCVSDWRGRPLSRYALADRFKRARDAAGLRPLRFHDLRHTYGSLLAAAGIPVTEIQAAMGHADIQTTARYLHARQASEQVERFARAFEA
jgi:integrase